MPTRDAIPVLVESAGRRFGPRLALDDVDLQVEAGTVVGLVGPNGSGKTTLLKLVAGLLRADSGRIRTCGHDPAAERARLMAKARFVFAPPALMEALTAFEHLLTLGRIVPVGAPVVTTREAEQALDTVGLLDRAHDRVRTYSFGMRQRLALALALVPRPELLVLDEPGDGLDPVGVRELRGVLIRLNEEHGVTILLSSHLMTEIDAVVSRLLVLAGGRTLFQGSPGELTGTETRLVLEVDDTETARHVLVERGHTAVSAGNGVLTLPGGALDLAEAQALLAGRGVRLLAFSHRRPSLEQALMERLSERHPAGAPAP